MKYSRSAVHCRLHKIPALRFETQTLTSFGGLVLFQALSVRLRLKERLRACFSHLAVHPIFGHHVVVLLLVVHLLLGYRELRDQRYYRDDPLVKRVLGLHRLPDVATISRALATADARSIAKLRALSRALVVERLQQLRPARLTVDFDGSVLSTQRAAEGSAVGFNKAKKGARSYYPLFCTIAQTGQVFDFAHRPGNVHDSREAQTFMTACIKELRTALPGVQLEARLDSAFFSEALIATLEAAGIEFTISVPFERFVELKGLIEGRRRWRRLTATLAYFETEWKPKSWTSPARFVFIRQLAPQRARGPVQLDLFIPHEWGYEFKVIVTNKTVGPATVLAFHNGRGAQETLFGQLKSQCQADYVPARRLVGNQLFLLTTILSHNLGRELQMVAHPPERTTTPQRQPFWIFRELQTLRRTLFLRAGRLTRPDGELTLTLSANAEVRNELLHCLDALTAAA
jgi:Transposase DDE domain group 1